MKHIHEPTYKKVVTFKNGHVHLETRCFHCKKVYYLPQDRSNSKYIKNNISKSVPQAFGHGQRPQYVCREGKLIRIN